MTREAMNFVFIGDDAFAMNKNLLKPYSHRQLTYEEEIFNYRLSRARRVIENVFGVMVFRFRILHTPIYLAIENIDIVIITICVLQNFLRRNCGVIYIPQSNISREDHGESIVINGE